MLIIHMLEYLKFIVNVMITTDLHVKKSAIFCKDRGFLWYNMGWYKAAKCTFDFILFQAVNIY